MKLISRDDPTRHYTGRLPLLGVGELKAYSFIPLKTLFLHFNFFKWEKTN